MKLFSYALASLILGGAAATPTPSILEERATSKSWAGTSCYFLQGMSAADQQSYLQTLASSGIKVIRLWVNGQPGNNHCTKGSVSVSSAPDLETTLGQYNNVTLDLLDQTLTWASSHGIKAIISPHDGNAVHGANGNDVYGQKFGPGYFYEQQAAYDYFDARLRFILNYRGKYSGKVWKSWSDAIMAFDLENEPFSAKTAECTSSSAQNWACGRAQTLRSTLGANNPIKIATGGFGGDISKGCTFLPSAMQCPEIDIVAVHRYAGPESSNQNQWTNSYNSWLKQVHNKLVFVEEWGVNTNNYDPKSEFPANTRDMNAGGLPWVYWQLLPHQKCSSNDQDGFGFFIDSGVDVAGQAKAAAAAQSKQDWTGIVY